MSVEMLSQIAGVLLSLAVAYIPGIADWYGKKDAPAKARVMGLLLVLVSVSIFGLACAQLAGDIGLSVACDKVSAVQLAQVLIAALIANQAAYLVAVRPFKK